MIDVEFKDNSSLYFSLRTLIPRFLTNLHHFFLFLSPGKNCTLLSIMSWQVCFFAILWSAATDADMHEAEQSMIYKYWIFI